MTLVNRYLLAALVALPLSYQGATPAHATVGSAADCFAAYRQAAALCSTIVQDDDAKGKPCALDALKPSPQCVARPQRCVFVASTEYQACARSYPLSL